LININININGVNGVNELNILNINKKVKLHLIWDKLCCLLKCCNEVLIVLIKQRNRICKAIVR